MLRSISGFEKGPTLDERVGSPELADALARFKTGAPSEMQPDVLPDVLPEVKPAALPLTPLKPQPSPRPKKLTDVKLTAAEGHVKRLRDAKERENKKKEQRKQVGASCVSTRPSCALPCPPCIHSRPASLASLSLA